jgi:hypothetical protein
LGPTTCLGQRPSHLPLMATVWAHKLSGWSVVSVVHLGVCDGHPQLVGPLAPPHAGRGVCSNTYTPLLPSFLSENECKPNSDGGGWCIEESKMLSACWGALPCDGDVSPNDCHPTPAAHLPCMICADDLSCSRCHDGRNGKGWHFFVCKPSPPVVFMTKQHPSIAPAHHGFFRMLAE